MPAHSYAVLAGFALLGIIFGLLIIIFDRENVNFLGKPTIERFFFISGKISLFASWGIFLVKAMLPTIGYIQVPVIESWCGAGLLYVGGIVFLFSIASLGNSLKVGLPNNKTRLITGGIYAFSRNPLYLGVYIICLASCIYFPDVLNVAFTVYGVVVHHRIIKGEETFLARRFGSDWDEYCRKVNRYY